MRKRENVKFQNFKVSKCKNTKDESTNIKKYIYKPKYKKQSEQISDCFLFS